MGIREVIANFWTINDPPGLHGLMRSAKSGTRSVRVYASVLCRYDRKTGQTKEVGIHDGSKEHLWKCLLGNLRI